VPEHINNPTGYVRVRHVIVGRRSDNLPSLKEKTILRRFLVQEKYE
jgi:hypothetical protein